MLSMLLDSKTNSLLFFLETSLTNISNNIVHTFHLSCILTIVKFISVFRQPIVQDMFHLHPIIKQKPSKETWPKKSGEHKDEHSVIFSRIFNNRNACKVVLFSANLVNLKFLFLMSQFLLFILFGILVKFDKQAKR